MAKDRSGLNSHELRFVAKLNSENSVDKIRRFVITYFLSDDTISIFEQSGTAHRTNPYVRQSPGGLRGCPLSPG